MPESDLANQGNLKIEWAKAHMPILNYLSYEIIEKKPFKNLNIAVVLHIEAKTANFVRLLKEGGANVSLAGSNPLSTQDDVVIALIEKGINVFARHGAKDVEYWDYIRKTVEQAPNILVDDGGDLINLIVNEKQDMIPNIFGACEETTTGVMREKALEREGKLPFPVIAVNNGKCKFLFDNRYGTGQSAWDGIIRTTNLSIAGKNVVVSGYGWVGKGIAMRGKGLGAKVFITEVDPINALEAHMDGFTVLPMKDAAKIGDIFITATSNTNVIDSRYFELLKDGCVLANAGHFNVEISIDELEKYSTSKREVRKNITEYTLSNGRRVYVLGEGRLVNLACADGHPIEIMDLSFSLQILSINYLLQNSRMLEKKVYNIPDEIDEKLASIALSAYGIEIDSLTEVQKKYLNK